MADCKHGRALPMCPICCERLVDALQQILTGAQNPQIDNAEFRVKAAQAAEGVLGDVGGSGNAD